MRKLSLAVVSAIALIAALSAPSLVARQQSVVRFEYLRLTPYLGAVQQVGTTITASNSFGGVRACVATSAEWACRNFQAPSASEDATRTALVTLGNEGWELVSAGYVDGQTSGAYLFKRQLQ
jgi:hypothetical protein